MMDTNNTNQPYKEFYETKVELSLIKKDVSQFDNYLNRIGASLEKMAENLVLLTKMVTLHEERIEVNQRENQETRNLIENHRALSQERHETLALKVETVKADTLNAVDKNTKRITTLEYWRYIIIGGAVVIFFLLSGIWNSYSAKLFNPNATTIEMPKQSESPSTTSTTTTVHIKP